MTIAPTSGPAARGPLGDGLPGVESRSPAAPGHLLGTFPSADAAAAGDAVARAQGAFLAWAARTAGERAGVLGAVAQVLITRADEFSALITAEEGKTRGESRGEVAKAAEQFRFAAQLGYLAEGRTYPVEQAGVFTYSLREPLGVVVAITPWNFPLSLPARKIAIALAAGNTVVFKPSPVTPAVAEAFVGALREAGVPGDAVVAVHGDDPGAMAALAGDPRVRAVTFTGSSPVGGRLRATLGPGTRLQAELSGHAAAVVCADADLPAAAREITAGAFGLSGQACTAAARALVDRSVLAAFTELVAAETAALVCGPPDAPGVSCGPVATAGQRDRLDALLATATAAGARVVAQASLADGCDPAGYYVRPTVLADVPGGHDLLRREVFGPLLSLVPVDGLDEALAIIAESPHGLAHAVHTRSLASAHRFARSVPAGIIKINQRTTGNGVAPPFGGLKASSEGPVPEGGLQALDFFTQVKAVYCQA